MSSRKEILKKLGLDTVASTLLAVPKKERGDAEPHTNVYHRNAVHQADILYLPHDTVGRSTYRFALVVVDLHTGLCDAEAVTNRDSNTVLQALKKIYGRPVLSYPNRMETDPGSEFKSDFHGHLKSMNIEHRFGKKGRHRHQSMVEAKNGQISFFLNLRMVSIEEITGQSSRDWASFLPTVVDALNQEARERREKKKKPDQADKGVRCDKKKGCELLEVGTRVRVILEEPVDNVTGEVLPGKFRKGDRRWDTRIRTVYQQVIRPDQPALYIVTLPESDKPAKVAHTREQLQVVKANDTKIDAKKLKVKQSIDTFLVDHVHDRKKQKSKVYFLVEWKGYPDKKDWTWEPRAELMKSGDSVKRKVKDFEAKK